MREASVAAAGESVCHFLDEGLGKWSDGIPVNYNQSPITTRTKTATSSTHLPNGEGEFVSKGDGVGQSK